MAKLQTVEFSTCLKPTEMVRELREIVVNSGWTYERVDSVRTVDRFAIIMPITQLAKSLGIKITSGPYLGLELLCWSHTPGSSGSLHFTSWSFPTKINDDDFDILQNNGVDINSNDDELFAEAVKLVTETRKTSISFLQRRLKIGYNRAANLIESMESQGILSAPQSNGNRDILKDKD